MKHTDSIFRPSITLACIALFFSAFMPVHATEDHSHHMHMMASKDKGYSSSMVEYKLPKVKLVRHDGRQVDFLNDIDDGKPVFVNFIYTSCTAICPVMTQIFSSFEKKLGAESAQIKLVSISIDPEYDTPKQLTAYAQQYGVGSNWTFYTGTVEASIEIQKGFAAYRGDKMNHTPLTLIRMAPGKPWLRIDGFATPDDLLREYQQLLTQK